MKYKVLIVDDSSFFRRRLTEILSSSPSLEVIGSAKDGQEAINMTKRLKPDVITMDIEMPVLDGISAVKRIMANNPTPILMFSSLTHEGARATLEALDAGALDFLPKKFEDIAKSQTDSSNILQKRVLEIARRKVFHHKPITSLRNDRKTAPSTTRSTITTKSTLSTTSATKSSVSNNTTKLTRTRSTIPNKSAAPTPKQITASASIYRKTGKRYEVLAIGTSTGGPVALQKILTKLPANFPIPILIIQHMPATFTPAFSTRLNGICKVGVSEAKNGDHMKKGHVYIAPGGKQMMVEGRSGNYRLKIIEANTNNKVNYHPCVDITFASLARNVTGNVLAIILTGMGADGRDGAKLLKNANATIWAQDEASCVVYGMPQAIMKAGLANNQFDIDDFAKSILTEVS